jgi:hypothetical protein
MSEDLWIALLSTSNNLNGVVACLSVILNSLVIATFHRERRSNKKLACGAVQLLFLAVTDAGKCHGLANHVKK